MAPKRGSKRKDPDPSVHASARDKASKPVPSDAHSEPGAIAVANSCTELHSLARNNIDLDSLYAVAAANAPDKDICLLSEVKLLGHYPRPLKSDARSSATQTRQDEGSLYQRLYRRKKNMSVECRTFLDAFKGSGDVHPTTGSKRKAASVEASGEDKKLGTVRPATENASSLSELQATETGASSNRAAGSCRPRANVSRGRSEVMWRRAICGRYYNL